MERHPRHPLLENSPTTSHQRLRKAGVRPDEMLDSFDLIGPQVAGLQPRLDAAAIRERDLIGALHGLP